MGIKKSENRMEEQMLGSISAGHFLNITSKGHRNCQCNSQMSKVKQCTKVGINFLQEIQPDDSSQYVEKANIKDVKLQGVREDTYGGKSPYQVQGQKQQLV
ncbi:uncharacterized protein VK521_000762 isoform 1-T1 [Ammospiza maritima maritima]